MWVLAVTNIQKSHNKTNLRFFIFNYHWNGDGKSTEQNAETSSDPLAYQARITQIMITNKFLDHCKRHLRIIVERRMRLTSPSMELGVTGVINFSGYANIQEGKYTFFKKKIFAENTVKITSCEQYYTIRWSVFHCPIFIEVSSFWLQTYHYKLKLPH